MVNRQRTIAQFGIDMRITRTDLATLSPAQIAAVYAGIGKVASLQHRDPAAPSAAGRS